MTTPRPSISPTLPSEMPSGDPTRTTNNPTSYPTSSPTLPSEMPTVEPTQEPTTKPTHYPTSDPTTNPTHYPTNEPTTHPTTDPTLIPTSDPTNGPTVRSEMPSTSPTLSHTVHRTTRDPTRKPTAEPSPAPSEMPSSGPSHPLINIIPTLSPTESSITFAECSPILSVTFQSLLQTSDIVKITDSLPDIIRLFLMDDSEIDQNCIYDIESDDRTINSADSTTIKVYIHLCGTMEESELIDSANKDQTVLTGDIYRSFLADEIFTEDEDIHLDIEITPDCNMESGIKGNTTTTDLNANDEANDRSASDPVTWITIFVVVLSVVILCLIIFIILVKSRMKKDAVNRVVELHQIPSNERSVQAAGPVYAAKLSSLSVVSAENNMAKSSVASEDDPNIYGVTPGAIDNVDIIDHEKKHELHLGSEEGNENILGGDGPIDIRSDKEIIGDDEIVMNNVNDIDEGKGSDKDVGNEYQSDDSNAVYPYQYAVKRQTSFYGLEDDVMDNEDEVDKENDHHEGPGNASRE